MLSLGEEQYRKRGRNRSNNSQDCWNTIRQIVTIKQGSFAALHQSTASDITA